MKIENYLLLLVILLSNACTLQRQQSSEISPLEDTWTIDSQED